jgi:hypothetical protein
LKRFRAILAVLVALFAVLTLLDRFLLVELLARRVALPLLVASAAALACIGTGAALRRGARVDPLTDFLLGYPLFGTLCFVIGTLRVSAWTMVPLLLLGIAALVVRIGHAEGNVRGAELPPLTASAFAVMVVLGCAFVAAQAPPASLDEVAYHLAVPHTWALEGRAIELPLLSHSYFPLGIESADLPSFAILGIDGGVASHFLHLFAAIATSLLIARRTRSGLATAAIVTTPALAITAGWSLVDWPLAGLFVVLFVAIEDGDDDAASLATAGGLLTKYTFIPFAIAAWIVAWLTARRLPRWPALFGAVFFVRNLVLTANPVAPFFAHDAPSVHGYRDVALADYIFHGAFVDESLGASLLTLPTGATGALALTSAVLAIAFFLLGPSSRLLVPYLVVPALRGAHALQRRLFAAAIALAVAVQLFLVVWFTARSNAFSLIAGGAAEEQYLAKQRPSYGAIAWLNQTLPPRSRTLVLGTNETYWFARPVRGGGNFDAPRLSRYLDLPTPEAVRERLRGDGITHVAVISAPPATRNARKQEERQTTLSPAAQRMVARMLDRYATNVTTRGNAALFTLR